MLGQHSFQEVARHWKRMCNKYWRSTTCHGCPIAEHEHCYEACSDIDIDISIMEEIVMDWAARHPDPVYPTWYEYLCDMYHADWNITIANNHIPADIAEKLGLEPKEGA